MNELKKRLSSEHELVQPKTSRVPELVELAKDVDVIFGTDPPQEAIEKAQHLKLVQVLHAGVSEVAFDLGYLKKRGILLGNVSGGNALAVAEQAIALVLSLAKKLVWAHNRASNGKWIPYTRDTMSVLLKGKRLGIVALGNVGSHVAKLARALDMDVLYYDVKRNEAGEKTTGARYSSLNQLLSESDFVVVCVPHTPDTEGMIDETALRRMKKTAYLVNMSRAAVVDERALSISLREGWIAGFASDVWYFYPNAWGAHYPTPSREGIHQMENVVVSPDRSAWIPETVEGMFEVAFENVERFAKGQPLRSQINLDVGY